MIFCLLAVLFLRGNPAAALDSFSEFKRFKDKNRYVSISALVEPDHPEPGQGFVLKLVVHLNEGWHIYAMHPHSGNSPLATRITIDGQNLISRGQWTESEPGIIFDPALEKIIATHQSIAEFSRPFTFAGSRNSGNHQITGTLFFRACDNKVCTLENRLPFQIDLQ